MFSFKNDLGIIPNEGTDYENDPNLLQGQEGQLLLRDKQGETYSITPKENEFIVHASSTDHYPKAAPNSTVDRIVLASNVGFL